MMRAATLWLTACSALGQTTTAIGTPVWEQVFPDIAVDTARQRLVTVDFVGTTWEWDGARWREMARGAVSSTRKLAFDPIRGRTVMITGTPYPLAHHEWDGHAWHPIAAPGLPAVIGPMAFDEGRNRLQLLEPGTNVLHEYDGTAWTPRSVAPGNLDVHLVYFAAQQRTVLLSRTGTAPLQIHTYNGTTWQLLATGGPTTTQFAATYDAARARIVTHGGGNAPIADTWEWDGATWTQAAANPAFVRRGNELAFDPVRGEVLSFGGLAAVQNSRHDTWTWNGTTWSQLVPEAAPATRTGFAAALEPSAGDLAVFGGALSGVSTVSDELWQWNGLTWQRHVPSFRPTARAWATMATAPFGGGVLMHGGHDGNGVALGDSWLWSGTAWSPLPPGPPARYRAGMTTDLLRSVVVLHGGFDTSANPMADTWEWNGAQWTLAANNGPLAQLNAPLACDLVGGGVLLVEQGGATWRWDGQSWTNVGAGPLHVVAGLGFDPAHGCVVAMLWGSSVLGVLQAWLWNGANWTQAPTTSWVALGRFDLPVVAVAADLPRNRSLTFTGTYLYARGGIAAESIEVGPPCADPAARTPTVTSFGLPRLGELSHQLDLRAEPLRVGALGLGLGPTNWLLAPGCVWQAGNGPALLATTNGTGVAAVPLPIPAGAWLRGVDVLAQFAVLEPAAAQQFVASAPMRLRLGD